MSKQSKRARFAYRAAVSRRYIAGFNRWMAGLSRPGMLRFTVRGPNTLFCHPDSEPMLVDQMGVWNRMIWDETGFRIENVPLSEVYK